MPFHIRVSISCLGNWACLKIVTQCNEYIFFATPPHQNLELRTSQSFLELVSYVREIERGLKKEKGLFHVFARKSHLV